jgi:ribosomal protein S18 acetylase RimI-like enzyme
MNESTKVAQAGPADAQLIALLGRLTFQESFERIFESRANLRDVLDRTFSVDRIRKSLQHENNAFWVAYSDELPVAYAKLKRHSTLVGIDSQQIGQLQMIYVLRDFLDQRIGLPIFLAVLEECRRLELSHLWLNVYHENFRAIRFYEKNGFLRHDFVWIERGDERLKHYRMVKEL